MAAPLEENMFDVRLIEARIRRGTVTAEQYAKQLASLPDDADNAETVRVHFTAPYGEKHARR
jgi:hypothetical protein